MVQCLTTLQSKVAFFEDLYWDIDHFSYLSASALLMATPAFVCMTDATCCKKGSYKIEPCCKVVSIHKSFGITVYLKLADVGLSPFHTKAPQNTRHTYIFSNDCHVNTLPVANIFVNSYFYNGTKPLWDGRRLTSGSVTSPPFSGMIVATVLRAF